MEDRLILNPVLNFLSRSLTDGVRQELIQKAAVAYFDRDTIIQAKKVLFAELSITTRMVTHSKDEDNILNMCKTIVAAAKQNLKIPKFVILSPCEVPTIGEAVNAIVVSKIIELSRKLDSVLTNISHYLRRGKNEWKLIVSSKD